MLHTNKDISPIFAIFLLNSSFFCYDTRSSLVPGDSSSAFSPSSPASTGKGNMLFSFFKERLEPKVLRIKRPRSAPLRATAEDSKPGFRANASHASPRLPFAPLVSGRGLEEAPPGP
jgi:hypothetical protein